MEDLPSEFDLVVVGTGLSESIIAAAASRVGKSVLHVDENEYYCGFWASFNLDSFVTHLDRCRKDDPLKCRLKNVEQRWLQFSEEFPEINGWNKEKILNEKRRFNIDLVPKVNKETSLHDLFYQHLYVSFQLNYCNGKLVELLISSNICRYTEFRAVDKVLTVLNGTLGVVPGSRADIFTNKNVSIIEKRLLMKFMTQSMDYDKEADGDEKNEFREFPEDGKFIDLMKQQRLSEKLIHYILYSMCMGNDETTFKEGIERIRNYLSSIGRYGNTPFLFPMYGCGEIPQCFCRLCAVFGGVYCLGRSVNEVKKADSNGEEVVTMKFGEQNITTKKLVYGLGSNVLDTEIPQEYISRAIFITSTPIGGSSVSNDDDGGGVVLLYLPVEGRADGVTMIQLSHYSGCVPKGLCKLTLMVSSYKSSCEHFQISFTFLQHIIMELEKTFNLLCNHFSGKKSNLEMKTMPPNQQLFSLRILKYHQARKASTLRRIKVDQFTHVVDPSWNWIMMNPSGRANCCMRKCIQAMNFCRRLQSPRKS